MAGDFRDHPMLRARGFNAPERFEADVCECELWGEIPSDCVVIDQENQVASAIQFPDFRAFQDRRRQDSPGRGNGAQRAVQDRSGLAHRPGEPL